MFDYTREYAEFKNYVEKICTTPEEKARITEEFALFEQRGWQKYVVVVLKIMRGIYNDKHLQKGLYPICEKGGSAYDSYAIFKFVSETYGVGNILLNHEHSKEVLFNDAFRLIYRLQSNHDEHNVKSLEHLDAIFDSIVKESGLYYAQRILKNGASSLSYITAFQEELLVLSETPIPNADIDLIATETRNSTEEEANRLRKYLIVKFSVTWYDHIPD